MSTDHRLVEMVSGKDNSIDNYGNIGVLSHVNEVIQSSFRDGNKYLNRIQQGRIE